MVLTHRHKRSQARSSCLPCSISALKEWMLIRKEEEGRKEGRKEGKLSVFSLQMHRCYASPPPSASHPYPPSSTTSYSIQCGRSPVLSSNGRSLSLAPGEYFPPIGTGHSAAPWGYRRVARRSQSSAQPEVRNLRDDLCGSPTQWN